MKDLSILIVKSNPREPMNPYSTLGALLAQLYIAAELPNLANG
jgi:hypothetical protein